MSTRHQLARAFKRVRRTSGNISISSTTWSNLDTGLDVVLQAAAGDTLEVCVNGLWNNEASVGVLSACTVVAGAPVSHFGSGEPTTTTGDGVMGWFGPASVQMVVGAPAQLVLGSGDLASGYVTVRLRTRTNSGTKTLNATTGDPLEVIVKNLGPADPN